MTAINVEFYGIPRQRAGVAQATVELAGGDIRLGDVIEALAERFPELGAACCDGRRLQDECVANLGGEHFVRDPTTPLSSATVLLILSADAGG
jgi:molybdopterin converting factor small subunit